MKLEELTALGIAEDAAKKVVELVGTELTAEHQKATEAEGKLTASAAAITELTEKVKAFDGVDVKKLQEDFAASQTKYSADIAAVKMDSAIDLALVKAGAKALTLAVKMVLQMSNTRCFVPLI